MKGLVEWIFYAAVVYVMLAVGCEYRNYGMGHRWIKAFQARTPYQYLFTLMQCRKDVGNDLGKLTYIGYIGVILGSISGMVVLVAEIYRWGIGSIDWTEDLVKIWAGFCGAWGVFCFILQGADSLINFILEQVFDCRKRGNKRYRRRRRRRRR